MEQCVGTINILSSSQLVRHTSPSTLSRWVCVDVRIRRHKHAAHQCNLQRKKWSDDEAYRNKQQSGSAGKSRRRRRRTNTLGVYQVYKRGQTLCTFKISKIKWNIQKTATKSVFAYMYKTFLFSHLTFCIGWLVYLLQTIALAFMPLTAMSSFQIESWFKSFFIPILVF